MKKTIKKQKKKNNDNGNITTRCSLPLISSVYGIVANDNATNAMHAPLPLSKHTYTCMYVLCHKSQLPINTSSYTKTQTRCKEQSKYQQQWRARDLTTTCCRCWAAFELIALSSVLQWLCHIISNKATAEYGNKATRQQHSVPVRQQ